MKLVTFRSRPITAGEGEPVPIEMALPPPLPTRRAFDALLSLPGFWTGLSRGRDDDGIAAGYRRAAAAIESGCCPSDVPECRNWLARSVERERRGG